ncbi:MAG: transporter [Planctomycetota bacterium]
MRTPLTLASVVSLSALAPASAIAQEAPTAAEQAAFAGGNKHDFHLFNPTPKSLRRPLSADRPDLTESPYTVDAGAFQLEMSFLEYTFNDSAGVETDTYAVAPLNLKAGLTNDIDIQFIWTPYIRIDSDEGDADGTGDLQLRVKINVWGNDGGDTAFALLPYITLPVGDEDVSSDDVEGGIVLPFALDLAAVGLDGLSFGTQIEFAFERNDADTGFDAVSTCASACSYSGVRVVRKDFS